MKVFVLGASGMLGNYVSRYLHKSGFEVVNVGRDIIDASSCRTDRAVVMPLEMELNVKEGDYIINCMGTIKPRVDELGDLNAIQVNSIFPRLLADACEDLGLKLIHPTTDCVYTGSKGSYDETDIYDVGDVYGMSKALGEPHNCMVIRTSIIGEEVGQGRSLVEWVKSEKGNTVFGYTNHYWNGITCLQFALICGTIIEEDNYSVGTKHLFSNTLNKAELVSTISDVYDLDITVTPKEVEISCDRSLSTIYPENLEFYEIPNLKTQIEEMKLFSKYLYE